MNRLKIFLTTFALCIMSVGFAFADSSTYNTNLKYKVTFFDSVKYKKVITYYCDTDFVIENGVVKSVGHTYMYLTDSSNGTYRAGESTDGFVIGNVDSIKQSSDYSTNSPVLKGVVPPQIAPTIQGAVQGVLPTFSSQLSQYLPKALVVFSMVLLVPLVPRVIRYFF